MKKVVVLGSTGSIGTNALRIIEAFPSRFQATGLAVRRDYKQALEQAQRVGAAHVAIADEEMAAKCAAEAPAGIAVHSGEAGMSELAAAAGADVVLCAVVGIAGLRPVMAAAEAGIDIALATKEVLVAAGQPVTEACERHGARILPVDSEHSAILQCLAGQMPDARCRMPDAENQRSEVRRIVLTASGGPFRAKPDVDFDKVTIEEVLDHPSWDMGQKVTVDSATLMNKGLEIAEAHWLFHMPVDRIDVVVHPESIIHSMVEFVDGSVIAQMSVPDMRFAIQYALAYPERLEADLPRLDLPATGALHFDEPDTKRFPALALARDAATRGGTMPAVLNAANEIAVEKFLKGEIAFSRIWGLVEQVMSKHEVVDQPDIDAVTQADAWAREVAGEA